MLCIVSCHDEARWTAAVDALNYDLRDIHFTAAWARAHERDGAKANLAVYDPGYGYLIAQPFLIRPIGERFDVASMGFGAPLSSASLPNREHGFAFADLWLDWMRDVGVVSEFCLLNPIFEAEQLHLLSGITPSQWHYERRVVVLPLDEPQKMVARMKRRRRRYLGSSRLPVAAFAGDDLSKAWPAFAALYRQMADRKKASSRWQEELATAEAVAHSGASASLFFSGRPGGEPASVATMVLFGRVAAYDYLAGTGDSVPQGAREAAILAAAEMARRLGCRWFYLGGGIEDGDSLWDFKQSFGGLTVPLYSYRRIVDFDAYSALCVERGVASDAGFFPAYRQSEAA